MVTVRRDIMHSYGTYNMEIKMLERVKRLPRVILGYIAGMTIYCVTSIKMTAILIARAVPLLNYERTTGIKVGMSVTDGTVAILVATGSGRDVTISISAASALEVAEQMRVAADAVTIK